MGQYWTPLNVDKGECYYCWGKLGAFFFSQQPHEIFFNLLRLDVKFSTKNSLVTKTSLESTCFPKLATELVAAIFDELEDAGDCFCLALTSQRCWLIGQPRMKVFVLQRATMWAGDRLICTGDYLQPTDLPECLSSFNYDGFIENAYQRGQEISHSCHDPVSILQNVVGQCHHIPLGDRATLLSSIRISYKNPEILRNISKREYVRRSAFLRMCKAFPTSWEDIDMDLGHIVISRICWSSDSSSSMRYEGPIHRGVWAGDRFDITSADAIEGDENGQQNEWEDVTLEVFEEIEHILSCQYD